MKKLILITMLLFFVLSSNIFADTPVYPDPYDPFIIPNPPSLPNQ